MLRETSGLVLYEKIESASRCFNGKYFVCLCFYKYRSVTLMERSDWPPSGNAESEDSAVLTVDKNLFLPAAQ